MSTGFNDATFVTLLQQTACSTSDQIDLKREKNCARLHLMNTLDHPDEGKMAENIL